MTIRILFLIVCWLCPHSRAFTQSVASYAVAIEVKGVKRVSGEIRIRIRDSSKRTVLDKSVVVTSGPLLVVEKLPPGEYSVMLYQDENRNGQLDTGMFGVPKEPYGYSNDATGKMGPPEFKAQLFQVNRDRTMTINLQYSILYK